MFSALLIGSAAAIVAAAIAYALGYRRGVTEKTARLNRFVESYDIAAQAADLGIWDWNLETGRLETDANMLRAFARDNAPPAPNAPGFLANVIHPDDQKEFFRAFTAAVKDRSLERFELRFRSRRQSGEVRHAQLVGRMIRDEKGWAKRFLGVSWNITAQVEADQEVARQAAAGRALVERLNLATRVAGITVWE